MSALPQPVIRPWPNYSLTELEAALRIGRAASSSVDLATALDTIAGSVLRVRGVHQLSLEGDDFPYFARSASGAPAACGIARAVVAAASREWGRLRLDFEPHCISVESPLRFARFIGQQIGLLLNRLSIAEDVELRKRQVHQLEKRVQARKIVPRARGLLARSLGVSEQEAFLLLVAKARQSRRSLHNVARSIVWGYEPPDPVSPALRRLQPKEVTSARV